MPFNIGPGELILILAIALLLLGPAKLPEVAQSLGKSVREFRRAATDISDAAKIDATTPQEASPVTPAAPTTPTATAPEPAPSPAIPPAPVEAAGLTAAPIVAAPVVRPPDPGATAAAVAPPVAPPLVPSDDAATAEADRDSIAG